MNEFISAVVNDGWLLGGLFIATFMLISAHAYEWWTFRDSSKDGDDDETR
jgi:hypothetical protein